MICRVTGKPIESSGKRGRPAEYASEDARQFAFRMAQLATLTEALGAEMTEEKRKFWRGELWRLANLLNARK